jgi:hypothetical protein
MAFLPSVDESDRSTLNGEGKYLLLLGLFSWEMSPLFWLWSWRSLAENPGAFADAFALFSRRLQVK